jgi:hypothetical protein
VVAFFGSNPPLQDARRAPLLTKGHSTEWPFLVRTLRGAPMLTDIKTT